MPIDPDTLRYFSDEISKVGMARALGMTKATGSKAARARTPGVPSGTPTAIAKPSHSNGSNLSRFTQTSNRTPTTGATPSGVSPGSLITSGTTGATALPSSPPGGFR